MVKKFIGFINCSASRDTQGLAILILKTLKQNQLSDIPIQAQPYAGAFPPYISIIHCLAHELNSVVVDFCANVALAKTLNQKN